jgi:hypothetical protein
LLDTDAACFDTGIADSTLAVRVAAERLSSSVADPFLWYSLEPDVRTAISAVYIDCVEDLALLRAMIAMGTINTMDSGCIVEAWADDLDAAAITSSLAVGLEDLEPVRLESMVADVMGCWADREWWIQDVALELEGWHDFTLAEAGCVANRMIEEFGLEPVIRRRLLTINVLAMPDHQLATLDGAQCGVEIALATLQPRSMVGNCIADLYSEDLDYSSVPCDTSHTGEVIGVEDVSTTFAEFPGNAALQDTAADMCIMIAGNMAPNDDVGVVWLWPSRETWERGDRLVSCVLVLQDGTDWTAPSGIAP